MAVGDDELAELALLLLEHQRQLGVEGGDEAFGANHVEAAVALLQVPRQRFAHGDLARQFADAFAIFEDTQFLVGNGVGGPQGVLQNSTTGGRSLTALKKL